jgi:hypothetical protein
LSAYAPFAFGDQRRPTKIAKIAKISNARGESNASVRRQLWATLPIRARPGALANFGNLGNLGNLGNVQA